MTTSNTLGAGFDPEFTNELLHLIPQRPSCSVESLPLKHSPLPSFELIHRARQLGFTCSNTPNYFFQAVSLALQDTLYKPLTFKEYIKIAIDAALKGFTPHRSIKHLLVRNLLPQEESLHSLIISALAHRLNVSIIIVRSDKSSPDVFPEKHPINTIALGYDTLTSRYYLLQKYEEDRYR